MKYRNSIILSVLILVLCYLLIMYNSNNIELFGDVPNFDLYNSENNIIRNN